jgi:hypothetical protein
MAGPSVTGSSGSAAGTPPSGLRLPRLLKAFMAPFGCTNQMDHEPKAIAFDRDSKWKESFCFFFQKEALSDFILRDRTASVDQAVLF